MRQRVRRRILLPGLLLAVTWMLMFFVTQPRVHADSSAVADALAVESHAGETQHPAGHHDPVTPVLLGLSIVLFAAKAGGAIAVRLRQPAVLGELLVGVLLGNLLLAGFDGVEFLRPASPADHGTQVTGLVALTLDMLARIGVILLLFEVGLESSVRDMVKVGWSSLLVAILGVVAPFSLGWFVGQWMLPNHSWHVHLFLGATLSATSVGITARVFKDLGKSDTDVAKIVLGAAVIDDVLGLVLLAVVQAVIIHGTADLVDVAWIVGKALVFLIGSVVLGDWLSPYLFRVAAKLNVHGMLMVSGLLFCFGLSWAASLMGLAPIVGAFAAGMILDEKHYAALRTQDQRSLEDWVLPVTTLLVPIFFVMMGFQVDLRSFRDPQVLILAAGITVAAIIGKQFCSLGAIGRGIDRLSIGFGMIPRGEVGLIFAAIGQGLVSNGKPVIEASVYSAVVVMVMVTTFVTPPLLNWSLQRKSAPVPTAIS
ncbi:cation:proton antiporter [Schlesneria paludicola]|uniref:cation:proton antiporter n=1 Tax=Schlesneria paludicola TaxID=360056 RepID=UPI000299E523|nr:cation:proton antiporter [Schlesneria paludicola]